jgi:HSP20 family molecular chaperone IbpA
MNGPKLIDEINRLFDELVREPWARPRSTPRVPAEQTQLDIEMPISGGQLGDVSVAVEGRQLRVRASRREVARGGAGGGEIERVFTLPEHHEVSGVEARFEGDTLHVHVRLRPERR